MQNDRKTCSCRETNHQRAEATLTRVPDGHKRERERNLIQRLLQLRTTRKECGQEERWQETWEEKTPKRRPGF